jgi:hypothetical protein
MDGELVAALKSIEAQRREAEATGANDPVPYDTIGQAGRLTTAAAEAAGLSSGERTQVEKIFLNAWNLASDRFATDATLDEARSNANEGFYVYQIRALPDRGSAGLHEFQKNLDSAIGEDRRKTLMMGLNKYDYFGGFGALDIEIEFSKSNQSYTYKYLNPQTGRPTRFGTSAIEEFPHQFGDTFDLGHFGSGRAGANQEAEQEAPSNGG